jgi:hypothetical protein
VINRSTGETSPDVQIELRTLASTQSLRPVSAATPSMAAWACRAYQDHFAEADSRLYLDSLLFLDAEDLFRLLSCSKAEFYLIGRNSVIIKCPSTIASLLREPDLSLEEARSDLRRCKIPTPESSCHIGVAVLAPGGKGTNPLPENATFGTIESNFGLQKAPI